MIEILGAELEGLARLSFRESKVLLLIQSSITRILCKFPLVNIS